LKLKDSEPVKNLNSCFVSSLTSLQLHSGPSVPDKLTSAIGRLPHRSGLINTDTVWQIMSEFLHIIFVNTERLCTHHLCTHHLLRWCVCVCVCVSRSS